MEALLAQSFERLLAGVCAPAVVREVERSAQAHGLWAQLEDSGFADMLVAEAAGGAGCGLRDVFVPALCCGRHALPVPLLQTMVVRAALAQGGLAAPSGPITIAPNAMRATDGSLQCRSVPDGLVADSVLAVVEGTAWLLPAAAAQRRGGLVHGSLQAQLLWPVWPRAAVKVEGGQQWLHAGALLTAAQMAGAMERVLEATLTYANDRVQFGKPIGKFQAVQQQLAVMAEQVFAARIAAQAGFAQDGLAVNPLRAAVAKARCGEAAEKVVAIAHAVHGAIGITAEYDLQLYTRCLQEWRGDFGSSAWWHAQLGAALLDAPHASTLDFLLAELAPAAIPTPGAST